MSSPSRDGRSARKNRNASRSSRWIMSLCLNITKRSDSAKLLVRRRVIHRELNESFVLFGQESIVVESCDIRQAKARPGTQCQLHKNTSIHGQNHPGVTTWNLHTYLFFIRSTLSTQTSFDNCMAIRYRRLFRILRSQFWINFIGALLLYHTALSMERTDKRMQTHAHAHSHTHARVDITGRSLV